MPVASRWHHVAILATSSLVLLVAGYGLAFHTPMKGALGLSAKTCPFAVGQSAAARETQRRQEAAALRGERPAAVRPALGFALEDTTRAKLNAWIAQVGATCAVAVSLGSLECKIPDAAQLPGSFMQGPATVFFALNDREQVTSVQLMVNVPDANAAAAALHHVRAQLEKDLGVAPHLTGEISSQFLAAGALRQTLAEFRFADYYASTRVTNMGAMGYYLVSETYQSLLD